MPGDRLQLAKTQPSSEHIQLHREDAHPSLVPQPAQPQQVPPAAQPRTEKVTSPKLEVLLLDEARKLVVKKRNKLVNRMKLASMV